MPIIPPTETPNKHVHTAGVQLAFSLTGVAPWTWLYELTDADSPAQTIEPIPASTLATNNAIKRKRPGWMDPGDAAYKFALTESQFVTIFGYFYNRAIIYWRLYYPPAFDASDMGFLQFLAWISKLQPGTGMSRDQNELILVDMGLTVYQVDGNYYYGTGTGYPLANP